MNSSSTKSKLINETAISISEYMQQKQCTLREEEEMLKMFDSKIKEQFERKT